MFDKLKGTFEIYSHSSLHAKDETLRSIEVKIGPERAMNGIIKLLTDLNYKKISYNDIYNEIFTSKAGYEVTIRAIPSGQGMTTIDVEVYGPNHRGKTRKALRYLLHAIKERIATNGNLF